MLIPKKDRKEIYKFLFKGKLRYRRRSPDLFGMLRLRGPSTVHCCALAAFALHYH